MPSQLELQLYDTANKACDYAYANATEDMKTLKGGRSCFYPVVDIKNGKVGVGINADYHYLVYQNNGFASFPMKWAYGRVIPMVVNGKLIFRKCTGINRFQSGHKNYWQRDANGELIPEFKQKRSWVHPGLPPKNFIEDAVDEAVDEDYYDIQEAIIYDKYESDLRRFGEF